MFFSIKRVDIEDFENNIPHIYDTKNIKIYYGEQLERDFFEINYINNKIAKGFFYNCQLLKINDVLVSDKDKEIILNDGDTLDLGVAKYRFHIIQSRMRRSLKANLMSYLAILLFIIMLLFELGIIIWVPYTLKHQKNVDLSEMKQDIYRTLDEIRPQTRNLDLTTSSSVALDLKSLLISSEDQLADYVRKYGNFMNWEQTRSVYRNLYGLKNIVDNLKNYKFQDTELSVDVYMSKFIDKLTKNLKTDSNNK